MVIVICYYFVIVTSVNEITLTADCVPVFEMAQRRHLYAPPLVIVYRLNSSGLRAFSVGLLGPRLWNSA